MKKINLALLIVMSSYASTVSVTFANDNNPFLDNYEQLRDKKIAPKGLVKYSFSGNDNSVTQMDKNKKYLELARETKQYGYALVHASEVTNFNHLVNKYKDNSAEFERNVKKGIMYAQGVPNKSISKMSRNSTFKKSDLSSFMMKKTSMVLESHDGNYIKGKGWDSLTRIIKSPKLGTVIINQTEFSSGGMIVNSDAFNFKINGVPAILIVKEDDTGNAETTLTWVTDTNAYDIQFDKNVNKNGLISELIALANSLAKDERSMDR